MEVYKQGKSYSQSSDSSSLKKLVGSSVIATHDDFEQINESGRFKKQESSKDFTESSAKIMYTSQDLDMRFIFLNIIVD